MTKFKKYDMICKNVNGEKKHGIIACTWRLAENVWLVRWENGKETAEQENELHFIKYETN